MEFDKNIPIYIQIMELLKRQMVTGELGPGDKMPSVREFSKDLIVNPTTVQRVYRELEQEELTFTKRGMGSYVTEDYGRIKQLKEEMARELTKEFIEKMSSIGMDEEAIIKRLHKLFEEEK